MAKDWDKALVPVKHWKEIHRVMKDGAFAFVMSIPRQDLLARMIINLEKAGFDMGFTSIYWLYKTGFPKVYNMSKAIDRKAGAKREVLGRSPNARANRNAYQGIVLQKYRDTAVIDLPSTDLAKQFDGSYGGYQPAPAVEVVLVAMKPLTEKTYVEQVLKNAKGISWLDNCRIPVPEWDTNNYDYNRRGSYERAINPRPLHEGGFKPLSPDDLPSMKGRFPANLLVCDGVLGKEDSRYFDLDLWWTHKIEELDPKIQKTHPFWVIPKPSQEEKNKNCKDLVSTRKVFRKGEALGGQQETVEYVGNYHVSVKPVRLMSYLITMGSQVNDTILDPFLGSGTTVLAAQMLKRKYLGIEKDHGYYTIARARAGLNKKNVKSLFKRKKK